MTANQYYLPIARFLNLLRSKTPIKLFTAIVVINVLVYFSFMELVFVDANVIIDAVTDENSLSFEYFTKFRGKSRAMLTSTHAIGEVVKFLYKSAKGEEDDFTVDNSIHKPNAGRHLLQQVVLCRPAFRLW